MTYALIAPNFNVWFDTDGTPLNNGSVFIGTAGVDAESNPIAIYSNDGLSTAVSQPITTTNGYLTVGGSPIKVFVGDTVEEYSVKVKNNAGTVIFTDLNFKTNATAETLNDAIAGVSTPTNIALSGDGTQDYLEFNESDNYLTGYENQNAGDVNIRFGDAILKNVTASDLLTTKRTNDEQARFGYDTGANRDCFIAIYDGQTVRRGYIKGVDNGSNPDYLQIGSDSGGFLDIHGSGDVRINNDSLITQVEQTFTPTFNGAPTATTREGYAIRTGNKVDVYIKISGFAGQRAALASGDELEIGNIPYISELASSAKASVNVVELNGTYFYENTAESSAGTIDESADVIKLYYYNENLRSIKTAGGWSAGDFTFDIHASFITN
jgi:hypothetical protein